MIKYLPSGEEVQIIETLKRGFLVASIYEADDPDEGDYTDIRNQFVVDNVFDSAPSKKYDDKIKYLLNEIESLMQTKRELIIKIDGIRDQEKDRFLKYKQYKQLERLDDFIDGKITHYVTLGYHPGIVEFEKAISEYNQEGLKLLTLFGDSGGNLNWCLNQYRDGSGSCQSVEPCCSYKEAIEKLQKHIDYKIAERGLSSDIVNSANEYHLIIGKEARKDWEKKEKEEARKEIKEHEKAIGKIYKKIKEVTGGRNEQKSNQTKT